MTTAPHLCPVRARARNSQESVEGFALPDSALAVDARALVGLALTLRGDRRLESDGVGNWFVRGRDGSSTVVDHFRYQGRTLHVLPPEWNWVFTPIDDGFAGI